MRRPARGISGIKGNGVYLDRFEKKFTRSDGCWNWHAGCGTNVDGSKRGVFRIGRNTEFAPRVAYALYCGDVPPGMCVLHGCDNPLCVNPAHLRLGTNEENTADMLRRGRGMLGVKRDPATVKRGYKRPFMARRGKLTDDMVRAIRVDERKPCEIAAVYGVSETTVVAVKCRRRKGHVPDAPGG